MSDHYHYGYADERHSHRGEYAEDRHDHGLDYAEKHHRHYDLENDDEKAQRRITSLQDEVDGLRGELDAAHTAVRELADRVKALEADTPQARQLQFEADLAAADAREYETHGHNCDCEFCYFDPEEDADQADEGSTPEHRCTPPDDYQRGQS